MQADLSVPFVARLASHGDRAALVTPAGTVTYTELAARVADVADRLGPTRRLVLVAGANEVDPIVTYLAALSAGHPVILVPGDNPGNLAAVRDAYDPDVVHDAAGLVERRDGTAHDLHPSLALLLSTSGSTGSPKLVRLSAREPRGQRGRRSPSYLGIRPDGRRGDHAAHALLLRALGDQQPPARGRLAAAHRRCRWSTPASGSSSAPTGPRPSPGCRTPSTCSTGSASRTWTCPRCATSPRPAAGSRRSGCAATPSSAGGAAGTCS